MKKLLCFIVALVFMLSTFGAYAQQPDITLVVNGNIMYTDVPPQIVNDRTMVPMRTIFNSLGVRVEWDEATRIAYTVDYAKSIFITIDSKMMVVDDQIVNLDVAPFISDGRTLIPARAVCEALGCTVDWDSAARKVVVKSPGYVEPPVYTEKIDTNPVHIVKQPEYESDLFALINSHRLTNGLQPLTYDKVLEAVALSHSMDMAEKDYFEHVSPEGVTLENRLDNMGIVYTVAVEDIAGGFNSAQKLFKAWQNSEKNMENVNRDDIARIGIGCYKSEANGIQWTVVYTD